MKNSNLFFKRHLRIANLVVLIATCMMSPRLQAQMNSSVTGIIVEEKSKQPVPYATVGLMAGSESTPNFITGTITDELGSFTISPVRNGQYKLQASSVGYTTATRSLEIENSGIYDAGTIFLQESIQLIPETVVVGERMKGKTENDRTVFFMNKKILSASGNAPEVLRHIPGVQVDLKQNISLEGNQNILLLVDGIERNKSYISQLNPSTIDRIEIINTPPANYDGDISGVINIVLKKDRDTGISGQLFTEIPTSKSIVYSFPSFSVQYGLKKLNLYTSYSGEINLEDIDETYNRQIMETGQDVNITSVERVRQKNLSHKFNYGFDYQATPRDMINYHGSVNPYSYEQDGKVFMDITGSENHSWNTLRDETDHNLNVFNSLYYKHLFHKQGSEIAVDISNFLLKSSSTIFYLNEYETGSTSILNAEKPGQVSTSIKIDYSNPLGENLMLNTGAKAGVKSMQNETETGFVYNEQIYALYGALHYKKSKYNLNVGLRTEYAEMELKSKFDKTELSVLPYFTFQYKLNAKQNLLFSYRRSVNRPSVFQLNPYLYIDNPYSVRKGNPLLVPQFGQRIYAEHSVRFNVSYFSYRLYYENVNNAINNLTFLNDSAAFETQVQNIGNIHHLGLQLLGSLKFGILTMSPSVRLYHQSTSGNSLAKIHGVENRNNWIFDAGFSSVLSFKHDFALSATFQYSTVKYNIQDNAYCDALYFLSLDKTFKNDLKIGLMAALPFARTFVYQGSEIEGQNFSTSYQGNLRLPLIPIMFRVSYQFQNGNNKTMVVRDKEEVPMRPKSGL